MKYPRRYLYLHLGPGGNAALERASLEPYSNIIEFWDQPILSGAECTYQNLVAACVRKFDSQDYSGVIAHSFGCNVAQSLLGKTRKPIDEMTLISPIRDISLGFSNLADALGYKDVAQKHRAEVARRLPAKLQTSEESEAFWTTVQTILSTPHFYRKYWVDARKLKEHELLLPKLPPLDATMWQIGLNDFFKTAEKILSPPEKSLIFIGEKDPYHVDNETEKKIWESQGFKVEIVRNAGHYPHIEADCLRKFR